MAVVQPTIISNRDGSKLIRWASMADGDTGAPVDGMGSFSDRCLQLTGTLSTGGEMTLRGSNIVGDSPTWFTMKDVANNAIVLTALEAKQILENPYRISPEITNGDGSTSLTVTIHCVRGPQ